MADKTSNAFQEIVPPSASASASSSNPRQKRKTTPCDVFINHRGPDSKHTLATSIYETLKHMGLQVFLDEPELDLGDSIPAEIEDAMTTSFLHIAILSPRYAQSPWCLAELSFMVKTGNTIIPVFDNVEISDIRWGEGVYTDAFTKHEASGRYTSQKLQEWRTALQKVTFLKGYIVKENDDEGKADLLKAIESYVKKHSQKIPLVVADHPVGLGEIVEDFERNAFDSSQDIRIVGIVGMGGCGKTTLAKEYYNKTKDSFYKCSFIPNVKDVFKNDLHKTQRKMLHDLGFHDVEKVDDIEHGKAIIAKYLRSIQVFIVLDDVDHRDQLESLMPIKDSLGKNSIVVVTSRESDILTSWGITCIYKMKKLNPEYAMSLFCCHAFPQASLIDEFESRVQEFLKVCQGLPLSLKVLGGLVRGKSQDYWDDQLKVVSRLLPKDIKNILKVSFDALEEEEKEIFLDICCFFIGEEKELAVTVWDESESGWNGLYSFTVLESKCLVEVDERNRITMHDHLRDLGKEIILRKEIAKSPYRLWSAQQIIDIELEGQESVLIRGVRGIRAETDDFYLEWMKLLERVRKSGRRFERRKLEILIVTTNYSTEELAELSAGLVWLRWEQNYLQVLSGCDGTISRTTLQPWLSFKKLRILELRSGWNLKELWSETDDPPVHLRERNISYVDLRLIPSSIGRLQHLKRISLCSYSYGKDAQEFSLPEEFCLLQSLEHIKLSDFYTLNSLPNRFGDLINLRHLDLSRCKGLMMLPASFKQLINLQYIDFSDCHKLSFPPDFLENMRNLRHLDLSRCNGLMMLPASFKQLINLQYIDFSDCHMLSFPPDILENMRNLETLNLCHCIELKELPQLVTSQGSLKKLDLRVTCFMELPDSIGQLSKLEELMIENPMLTALPASIGNLSSLTELRIYECHKLNSLPETLEQLTNLQSLNINCCPLTELSILSGCFSSSSLCSLKSISLKWMSLVTRISISQQCCPCLESLKLIGNRQLEEIDSLPKSVKSIVVEGSPKLKRISPNFVLPNLESLVIEECKEGLEELPNFAESLSLRQLEIRGCGQQVKKIEGLENCRSLKTLIAETCWEAPGIQSLENTESLRRVQLSAWNISALEPCLQTIKKKWPAECVICARSTPGVEEVVKSLHFPGLTLNDYIVGAETMPHRSERITLKCGQRRSSNEATMVCYVINSFSNKTFLSFPYPYRESMKVVSGKWVWIGVFTQSLPDNFVLWKSIKGMAQDKDTGMLWIGEKNKVMEAFYKLLQHLQNVTLL